MFVEKLNKKQEGVYVIEEEKPIVNGKWEGFLDHDNVDNQSIVIYTGSKFTGEKVDNFFISTPSESPWKTYLKAFSNSEKIYITYESKGDQVEAEDINSLQNILTDEIDRAKSEEKRIEEKLDNEIARAVVEDERLSEEINEVREKKADKTYVDIQLSNKYNKDEVFTKEEVLQKIEEIIDAAPEALNTLGELARALNEDPDFAATITTELAKKVDKVSGKGLSTNDYTDVEKQKLAGIEEGANKYVHPSTHPASIITESSSRRFVSDEEKAKWNAKWDYNEETIKNIKVNNAINADMVNGKTVEANVPVNAKFTDTTYDEITEAEIDDGTSSTKRTITGRRIKYILDKVQGLIFSLTKADIGLDNVDNVKQATKQEFDSHNNDNVRHITDSERTKWNNKAELSDIPTKISELENDMKYVTQTELGNAGYGDMLKAIYDSNDNGKVDVAETAEKVEWNDVVNKPSTFPPSSHDHDERYIRNTGGTIQSGDLYMDGGSVNYVRPDTTGGWARGFWWSKRDFTRIGGIGVLGNGETISKFYIGYGTSPWQGSIIEIFPDSVNINGTIKQQGNEVWHKGKPLTWNDLKGV